MAKKAKKTDFMTPYEVRMFKGMNKTPGDELQDDKMMQNTLKRMLGMEVEVELDDGTSINVPTKDLIVARKIAYDVTHPKEIDLKMYASVLGENEFKLSGNLKTSSELFGDLVIKESEEGRIDAEDE